MTNPNERKGSDKKIIQSVNRVFSSEQTNNQELNYYVESFRKIRNKKYEFYTISRIIHRLNDPELEFTTQQLVRTDEGRYLLDLYFPQLKLAIEVDEDYHNSANKIAEDQQREKAVIEVLEKNIRRINASKHQSLENLNTEIDKVVEFIKEKKEKEKSRNSFKPFNFGAKYDVQAWINKQKLSVSDDARFKKHTDVALLFGKNYEGHQLATIKLDEQHSVWFPKLYRNGDWDNKLSDDGMKIEMLKEDKGKYSLKDEKIPKFCYVFAHYSDVFGNTYYSFKGVFELIKREGNYVLRERVSDTMEYDGNGKFSYTL